MNCVWNSMLKFWERRVWPLKERSDSIEHVVSSSNAFVFYTKGDQHELVHFSARTLCFQVVLWFLSIYDGTYRIIKTRNLFSWSKFSYICQQFCAEFSTGLYISYCYSFYGVTVSCYNEVNHIVFYVRCKWLMFISCN
jgi:hypothetical protein